MSAPTELTVIQGDRGSVFNVEDPGVDCSSLTLNIYSYPQARLVSFVLEESERRTD